MITLRVRSPTTVQRVNVNKTGTIADVYGQLKPANDSHYLSTDPQGKCTLSPSHPVSSFTHGDFIYLHSISDTAKPADGKADIDTDTDTATADKTTKDDNVDDVLSRRSGRVMRKMDPRVCRHGPVGMCEHCQPLEPWQTDSACKHLPLHAHLRRRHNHQSTTSDYQQRVPTVSRCDRCKGREGVRCGQCGIATAVPLKLQPYRLIDHLLFEDRAGVEAVVEEWRRTGLQRFAYLFGRVIPRSDDDCDLGITAVVEHCYQPPSQRGATDGVQLLEGVEGDLQMAQIVANHLHLHLVGCLYTDLCDDGTRTGKVVPRHLIVSAPELCFMADHQQNHCRFVTCIVGGSARGDIEPEAYMASDLAVDMRDKGMMAPCTDPHSLLLMAGPDDSSGGNLEFIYTKKNEYGYEVPQRAKPGDTIPVDYFIVSVSHGFVQEPPRNNTMYPQPHMHPTIEQAIDALSNDTVSFNLLLHLVSLLGESALKMERSELYATLLQLADNDANTNGKEQWTCSHCTFINSHDGDCEMCGLPQ